MCVKASLLSPYLQLSPSAAGTSRNGMVTSETSGAPAITSELVQTLHSGVCSFRARQAVRILPPKQNMAIWGELAGRAGTSLAQGSAKLLHLQQLPLSLLNPKKRFEVGRDIKWVE